MRREGSAVVGLAGFAAGAIAVLLAHQPVLALLHARGVAPWEPWSTAPTRPFGVPGVVTAVFWGGAWGVPLALALRGARSRGAWWGRAAAFGAVAPNAVGALLVAAGQGPPARESVPPAAMLASAVVVNAAWALAAAAVLGFARRRVPAGQA